MSVYYTHITEDNQEIAHKAEIAELTLEDLEQLEANYLQRNQKMEELGKLIKSLRAEAKSLEEDERELKARKIVVKENMNKIRDIVLREMVEHGEEKAKFGTVRYSVTDQGACIVIKDAEAVYNYNPEFAKKEVTYKVDRECKKKLEQTLEENGEVAVGTEIEFRKYVTTT